MKKNSTPDQFVVNEKDGKFEVTHLATDTVVLKAKDESVANEALVTANELVGKSRSAILKRIKDGHQEATKKFYQDVADLLKPKTAASSTFKPSPKGRDSYQSAARQSFSATNITEKEKLILAAMEDCAKKKVPVTSDAVSIGSGLTVNAINGSVSVLLAKGVVSSVRAKVDGKAQRVYAVEIADWRELIGKADEEKAKKVAARKEKEAKEREMKKSAKAEAKAKAKAEREAAAPPKKKPVTKVPINKNGVKTKTAQQPVGKK